MSGRDLPFRRLARAFPAGRRRDELLDTMLMAAADDARSRPTRREIVDVLRHAPRAWLGRPGSRGVVVAAVAVALVSGLLTACLSARAAWTSQDRPLPTAAEMVGIGQLVTPGVAVGGMQRHDDPFVVLDGETHYGFVRYQEQHIVAAADRRRYAAGVTDRLRQAGWRTDWITRSVPDRLSTGDTVMASKDGLLLRFETFSYDVVEGSPDGRLQVDVRRAESRWTLIAAATGALLGMVLGWLLTGWVSRRFEHHRGISDALAVLAAVVAVPLIPLALLSVVGYADVLRHGFSDGDGPFWSWTVVGDELMIFTVPSALAALVATAVIVLSRPDRGAPPPTAVGPGPRRPTSNRTGLAPMSAAGVTAGLAVLLGVAAFLTGLGGIGSLAVAGAILSVVMLRARRDDVPAARSGPHRTDARRIRSRRPLSRRDAEE